VRDSERQKETHWSRTHTRDWDTGRQTKSIQSEKSARGKKRGYKSKREESKSRGHQKRGQ